MAVILAILCGAELGGLIGIFLAIPAVAILTVTYRHYREHRTAESSSLAGLEPNSRLEPNRSANRLESIETNYRSRRSIGATLRSAMQQVTSPARSSAFGSVSATSEARPRARRGPAAGRRSADKATTETRESTGSARRRSSATSPPRKRPSDTILAQRDRMIAIFGHDLRGLLNALTVNAELFLRREGEAAVESAKNVRLAVGRMDQLVTSLLD